MVPPRPLIHSHVLILLLLLGCASWWSCAAQSYTTIQISPPPASCVSTWTSDTDCNPLKTALATADSYLRIQLAEGEYFNKGWSGTVPPASFGNTHVAKLQGVDHIIIEAVPAVTSRPRILFDGAGAFYIKESSYITIRGLDIEGPNDRITGHEASLERQRRTGRSLPWGTTTGVCSNDECHSCTTQSSCTSHDWCKWDASAPGCLASSKAYYTGNGIAVWGSRSGYPESHHITIEDNRVSKCPGSGIRSNKADNMLIRNNVVFDNVWWTTAASSGVVFAECVGTGSNTISQNVVFGNRNFMPFFNDDLSSVSGSHEAKAGYASFNASYIIDGSGIYITRNQDYQGVMNLSDNVAYDNGINGLVVHKTNHANVLVVVERNVIFGNGRTTRDVEGRQAAGGLVVNRGPPAGGLRLVENTVFTDSSDDFCYQCFGSCSLSSGDARDNVACVGQTSSSYPTTIFKSGVDCSSTQTLNPDAIRAQYSQSMCPSRVPQYSFFQGYPYVPDAACAAHYRDGLPASKGRTWNYYSSGCQNQHGGECLVDAIYCPSGRTWIPGDQGFCGERALKAPCGCCAAATSTGSSPSDSFPASPYAPSPSSPVLLPSASTVAASTPSPSAPLVPSPAIGISPSVAHDVSSSAPPSFSSLPMDVSAPSPSDATCAAHYGDSLPAQRGKTWNYYSSGCRSRHGGTCYIDSTYCPAGRLWIPGNQGYCGQRALGVACGCCTATVMDQAPSPSSATPASESISRAGTRGDGHVGNAPSPSTAAPSSSPSAGGGADEDGDSGGASSHDGNDQSGAGDANPNADADAASSNTSDDKEGDSPRLAVIALIGLAVMAVVGTLVFAGYLYARKRGVRQRKASSHSEPASLRGSGLSGHDSLSFDRFDKPAVEMVNTHHNTMNEASRQRTAAV